MQNITAQPIVQKIDCPTFNAQSLTVQVLRMDLLHPVISGNKWMKLRPWVQKAISEEYGGIVSKGGPWSNHLHAAAYTCSQQELAFTAIVKASEGLDTPMLVDLKNWGGRVIYSNHKEYNDEAFWQDFSKEGNALYIPMGGEGSEGRGGVTDFFNHLALPSFSHIVCPLGTGTTFMGIAGSSIEYQVLIGTDPGIHDAGYTLILNKLWTDFPEKEFLVNEDRSLKKFGKWPQFLPQKMNEWYSAWHLPTDIVYTAKMLYQFEKMVEQLFFPAGSSIMLVHTGGLQGNRSLPTGLLDF